MLCKWQVEIDDYANRVLARHWPTVHRERDIRECGKHNLEAVDVICGGFPCQDISYAGLGAGLDGERSGLFFETVRVVLELQPQFAVLENVAALLTRGLDRVLGTLAEIGYDAEWHCIPAAAVGAPHIRDRVFVLANRTSNGRQQRQPNARRRSQGPGQGKEYRPLCSGKNVADSARGGLEAGSGLWRNGEPSGRWQLAWRGEDRGQKQWAIEPGVGRVADGVSSRVDRLRGLGNAVVPQVAEWIGQRIIESIE